MFSISKKQTLSSAKWWCCSSMLVSLSVSAVNSGKWSCFIPFRVIMSLITFLTELWDCWIFCDKLVILALQMSRLETLAMLRTPAIAFLPNSISTISTLPYLTATNKGLRLKKSCWLMLGLYYNKILTIWVRPLRTAQCRGVNPNSSKAWMRYFVYMTSSLRMTYFMKFVDLPPWISCL